MRRAMTRSRKALRTQTIGTGAMARTYLALKEVDARESAARYLRDRLLVRVIFWSMVRVSETIGRRVEDVDFDQGTLTIKHLKTRARILCPYC